jgi:hypothetical protein
VPVVSISELFKAGPPLTEDEQVGRSLVISALYDQVASGAVVRLFDQRREGKTSLALAVLARARKAGLVTSEVPLDEYPTAPAAAARVLAQLSGAKDRAQHALGPVARIAARVANAAGDSELAALINAFVSVEPGSLSLATVLHEVRRHFDSSEQRALMLIDEAHLLADWADEDQAAVRALMKSQGQRIGIVLASSEESAEQVLIPILKFLGEPFVLPRIAGEDWRHDLRSRFGAVGSPIEDAALDRLLQLSTGQPYCTMLLAHQCAEVGQAFGKVNVDVVELALSTVSGHEAWQRLRYS